MGFWDRVKSGAKSFGRGLGKFARIGGDLLGKFSTGVRDVGKFLNRDDVRDVTSALSFVPFIGQGAQFIQGLARPLEHAGNIGIKAGNLIHGAGTMLQTGNYGQTGGLIRDGLSLYGDIAGTNKPAPSRGVHPMFQT